MITLFHTAPTLKTKRLTLGPVTPDHAEAFIEFCTTDASKYLGGPSPRRDVWESVAMQAGQWTLRGYGVFWLSAGDTPVGRVGIFHPDRRAEPELSWVIYPEHQSKGYATEAAISARNWAYAAVGLPPLMSLIDETNLASIRVAEKLGATFEAPHDNPEGKPILRWRHLGHEAGP